MGAAAEGDGIVLRSFPEISALPIGAQCPYVRLPVISDALSTVFSRHTGNLAYQCDIRGHNLNSWCRVPGSPFVDGLHLLPNHPSADPVSVAFGPIRLPAGPDTLTCLFSCSERPTHDNVIGVHARVLDDRRAAISDAHARLQAGGESAVTLTLDPPGGPVILLISVLFEEFTGGRDFGSVRLRYALAYRRNELVDRFNATGSDKGTEVGWGAGVPHCYALTYEALFAGFRQEPFNLLEIGLDTASQHTGDPRDAPSLRVWRDYFPQASLFGYDINDFSFLELPGTVTHRGDQSSRQDLTRFLEANGLPRFRVILDDGSHASSHQQISLSALFPYLEPGGLYVIEDLHWQPEPETPSTLEVLRAFNAGSVIASPFIEDAEARALEAGIEAVVIAKPNDAEVAIITKKGP